MLRIIIFGAATIGAVGKRYVLQVLENSKRKDWIEPISEADSCEWCRWKPATFWTGFGKSSVLKIVLYSLFYFPCTQRYTSKQARIFFLELLIGFEGVSGHRSWSNPEIPKLG